MGLIDKISSPSSHTPAKSSSSSEVCTNELNASKFLKPNFASMPPPYVDASALISTLLNPGLANVASHTGASQENWKAYFQILLQQQQQQQQQSAGQAWVLSIYLINI